MLGLPEFVCRFPPPRFRRSRTGCRCQTRGACDRSLRPGTRARIVVPSSGSCQPGTRPWKTGIVLSTAGPEKATAAKPTIRRDDLAPPAGALLWIFGTPGMRRRCRRRLPAETNSAYANAARPKFRNREMEGFGRDQRSAPEIDLGRVAPVVLRARGLGKGPCRGPGEVFR